MKQNTKELEKTLQKGKQWQNKHDLTRVIVLEITAEYFIIGNAAFKELKPKKFRTKLRKEVFFQHFEKVSELILALE
jgi:hypothetical protein